MQDHLRISCSRQSLQQVHNFVRDFLLEGQGSELVANQIVLAVDEVVANFIIHANGEDASRFLDLALELTNHRLNIEIEDESGNLFLPQTPVPNPDMREYIRQGRKGGMGMALVSRIMDQVEFFERNSHTICHLSKVLS